MVKKGVWIGFFLCFWFAQICASEVTVEANINQNVGHTGSPLDGTVTITHDKGSTIDPKSFILENKGLETTFVKNVQLPGQTVISIYSFTLPAESKGTHTLPSISVKVGNKIYKSMAIPYEVRDDISSFKRPTIAGKVKSNQPASLRLEAVVRGPSSLYLGERTTLVYRISFNRSIDLTQSDLPFIHAKSFRKIGDAQIQDKQEEDLTIQEIAQEIEASQLGTFKFGPSKIEGRVEDDGQLLHAEAPTVEIVVHPFPPEQQPESFTGALGIIEAETALKTPAKISVGDLINLEITVSGITNSADLHLPTLLCQPGFSGFFQIDDLPPAAEMKGTAKVFHIELRALTPLIKEVPSIELSSFDLETKHFHVIHTTPIPLSVLPSKEENVMVIVDQTAPTEQELVALLQHPAPPLEVREIVVSEWEIPWFQRGWTLLAIPIGLALLFLQLRWRQRWENRPKPVVMQSDLLLKQAKKTGDLKFLERAVICRLEEYSDKNLEPFLWKIRTFLYGPKQAFSAPELVQECEGLFSHK